VVFHNSHNSLQLFGCFDGVFCECIISEHSSERDMEHAEKMLKPLKRVIDPLILAHVIIAY